SMPNQQNLTLQTQPERTRSSADAFPPIPTPNGNQYMMTNHLPHSPTVNDAGMNTLAKMPYKQGTYNASVIHELVKDDRKYLPCVDRMSRTYECVLAETTG
ncbi:autolysin, partial [Staphylococcus pseudintermedius]